MAMKTMVDSSCTTTPAEVASTVLHRIW